MSFIYTKYLNKPVQTKRDSDNNLLSITSSDISYKDDSQFIEIENNNYSYNINNKLIDFDFKELNTEVETVDTKKSQMFNLYNEVKNDIQITGLTESHEYLFNSSKSYLNKDNLIILDNDEYFDLVIGYSNSIDDLNVMSERKTAEKEIYDRQNTAIYDTFSNIVSTGVQLLDSNIIPNTSDNNVLSLLYSLKTVLGQTTTYLLDNRSSLTNKTTKIIDSDIYKDRGIETKKENNTITYTYLSNQQPLIDAFNSITKNVNDNSQLLSTITSLQIENNKLKRDVNDVIKSATQARENDLKKIEQLNVQILKLKDKIAELEVVDDINDTTINRDIINRYNYAYDETLKFINLILDNTEIILNMNARDFIINVKTNVDIIVTTLNKLQNNILSTIKIETSPAGVSNIINNNNLFYQLLNTFIFESNRVLFLETKNINSYIEEGDYFNTIDLLTKYNTFLQENMQNIKTLGKL